jgi:hypothetical protein
MLQFNAKSKGDAFGLLLSSPIFEGVDQKIIEINEEFIADVAWDAYGIL